MRNEKLHLYVPTRGRIDRQHSIKYLRLNLVRDKGVDRVSFVVPECEEKEFSSVYPWATVWTVPDSYKYGDVIHHLVTKLPGDRKVVIDDDLQLLRRRNPLSISQKDGVATDTDALDLFERIRYWFGEGFAHGGISLRQTNHFCKDGWYKINSRCSGMMFFDSKIVRGEEIRFDAVQERSDFHVLLSLLERGYPNVCDYEFTIGQYLGGTNAPGGCSRYRDPQFLLDQAEELRRLHPKSVKVIFKQRVSDDVKSMGDEKGNIPDVKIGWAKSFNNYINLRKLPRTLGSPNLLKQREPSECFG